MRSAPFSSLKLWQGSNACDNWPAVTQPVRQSQESPANQSSAAGYRYVAGERFAALVGPKYAKSGRCDSYRGQVRTENVPFSHHLPERKLVCTLGRFMCRGLGYKRSISCAQGGQVPFVKMIGRFVPKDWPQSTTSKSMFWLLLVVMLCLKKSIST